MGVAIHVDVLGGNFLFEGRLLYNLDIYDGLISSEFLFRG